MVKLTILHPCDRGQFESDVIPDSGQTGTCGGMRWRRFESDVIPDSGQTHQRNRGEISGFESDVIPDSGQTPVSRI